MKKLITILGLFISINVFSQDTISVKRFSLAVGPTWGSANWGGSANLSYAVGKKFNLSIKGFFAQGSDKNFYGQYSVGIQNRPTTDISVSANYFLLGNTNQKCKAALYFGLGYLQQTSNTTNLYPGNLFLSNNPNGSYIDKDVSKGLAANTKIGAEFKLGPGKLYIEAYFSISFVGESTTSFTFMNQFTNPANSPKLQVNKYIEDFDPAAILCFNVGYAIPF